MSMLLTSSWSGEVVSQVEFASSELAGVRGFGTPGDLAGGIESRVLLKVLLIGRRLIAGIEAGGDESRRLESSRIEDGRKGVISASCCAFIRSWIELERRNVSIICKQNV